MLMEQSCVGDSRWYWISFSVKSTPSQERLDCLMLLTVPSAPLFQSLAMLRHHPNQIENPTPEEIAVRAAECREKWSLKERERVLNRRKKK